jgi:hypothetical protein
MKFNTRSPRLSPLAAAVAVACTGTGWVLPGQYVSAQEQADEEITITG